MTHNSFHTRDVLRALNSNPIVQSRRDPHRNVGPTAGRGVREGEITLADGWKITCGTGARCEELVAVDLGDFLHHMGATPDDGAAGTVRLEVWNLETGFLIEVSDSLVLVRAADAAALWAAIVHLENEMRTAGGPFLAVGHTRRKPAWPVQMSAPAWGANLFVPDLTPEYLGDDAFRVMAHHGVNGMLLYGDYLCYATGTRFGEIEHPDAEAFLEILSAAARRALDYGIRFYYCPVSPKLRAGHPLFAAHPSAHGARLAWKASDDPDDALHCLCSSDPEALAFHAEVMQGLFRRVPELGGLILIIGGESYYHCFMRAADSKIGETNCPACRGKSAEEVVANFVRVTERAVHQVQPGVPVMAWPYSAHHIWSSDASQLAFLDELAPEVAFLSEIDKDQTLQKDGYTKRIWDYSVEFTGPSDRIVAQALHCRSGSAGEERAPRDLFIKTETAHGIELVQFPYVPCLQRLARKWQSVRSVQPSGVLQTWGFCGMFDSVAERLGYEACWNPGYAPNAACEAIAGRLFGAAAPVVLAAWRCFDEAIAHIPVLALPDYYLGPMFLGPAHPLPVWEGETPAAFRGSLYYLQEADETFSDAVASRSDDLLLTRPEQIWNKPPELTPRIMIDEFASACELARNGFRLLDSIDLEPLTWEQCHEVQEQLAVGDYLYRTFRTVINVCTYISRRAESGHGLEDIVRDELENTRDALHVLEVAPWLNLNLRLDVRVPDCTGMMREKIRLLEEAYPEAAKPLVLDNPIEVL